MATFGEKLRKQREQRGLALDAVSNSTKISTRMLRALEEEHFDQLPGGVFNKGFVRAYARQVGLNEEEAVSEYLEALRENQVQSQQILPDLRHPGTNPRAMTPQDSRHHILPAGNHPGSDAGNNGGGDAATEERRKQERRSELRRSQDREVQKKAPREARIPQSEVTAAPPAKHFNPAKDELPAVRENEKKHSEGGRDGDDFIQPDSPSGFITLGPGAAGNLDVEEPEARSRFFLWSAAGAALLLLAVSLAVWISRRRGEDVVAPAPSVTENPTVAQPPATAPTVASSIAPKNDSASTSVKVPETKPAAATSAAPNKISTPGPVKPSAIPPAAGSVERKAPPATAAPKAPSTFTLQIRAEETTWISVTADGKPVIHETLIAPAHTSVRATHDVAVKVGNAAGVSFQMNGKEFPAQGSEGEVRTFAFDGSGLRSAAATPQTPQP